MWLHCLPLSDESAVKPTLLVLTTSFYPDENAEALVNTRLVRSLASEFRITVLSRVGAASSISSLEDLLSKHCPEASVVRSRSVVFRSYPAWRALVRVLAGAHGADWFQYTSGALWTRRTVKRLLQHFARNPPSAIMSFSGFCHPAAVKLCSHWGAPLITVWNDPFPPCIVPEPYGRGMGPMPPPYWRRTMQNIATSTAIQVFVSSHLRDFMKRQLGSLPADRCFIIPHLAPCCPREQPVDHRFLITHAGGLLPSRQIDTFLSALRSFLDADAQRRKETVFRVIGPNAHLFIQKAQEYGVLDISEHLGEVPYATCTQYLHSSTVLLLVEALMPSSVFLPSKLADYVGAMRPVLAVSPRMGSVGDYIREFGGGLIGDVHSPSDILRALTELHCSWSRGTLESDFPTQRLRDQFSESAVTASYKALLRQNNRVSMAVAGVPLNGFDRILHV